MIQNEEYIVFDVKALVFYILRQWKALVIWGVIMALVMGSWMAYGEYKTSLDQDTGTGYWAEYQQYQDQIAIYEDRIALTESRINTLQKYINESILMRIDPRNVYRSIAVYYLDTGYQILPDHTYQDTDKTPTLTWYYRRYITEFSVIEEISAKLGVEAKYLSELVEVSIPNDSTLYVSVRHPDRAGAIQILDMLQEKMGEARKEMTETIGDHTITLMEDTCGVYIDDYLRGLQKDADEELLELKDDLLIYSQELLEIQEGPAPDELNIVKAFIKWFIVGGVVGTILVAAVFLMLAFLGNRVHAASQLVSGFQTAVLGEVILGSGLSAVSRLINGLEGCVAENSDENLKFVAENVKYRCGSGKNILVCCDTDPAIAETVAQSLGQHLAGIRLIPTGNLLKEAGALRQLSECDSVLMVASRDQSHSGRIRKTLATVKSYNKEAIGFIIAY